MTPSTGRFPFHSRLGNAEKGKWNKVRSNCRKRLCGPDLVALESHLLRRPPAPFLRQLWFLVTRPCAVPAGAGWLLEV